MTAPTGVSVAHYVIRWRKSDFNEGDEPTHQTGGSTSPKPTAPTRAGTWPPAPDPTSPSDMPQRISSSGAVVGMVFGALAVLIVLCCGTAQLRRNLRRRRRRRNFIRPGIELRYVDDGKGIGIRVLHGHESTRIDRNETCVERDEEEGPREEGTSGNTGDPGGNTPEESNMKLAE